MPQRGALAATKPVGHRPISSRQLGLGALALAALSCWSCAPSQAWHLTALDAPDAWKVSQGEGVVIAILDTGLDDSRLPGMRSREVGPRPAADLAGHGTAVATVAAGSGDLGVWGIAPRARILPLDVADARGEITADAVARAVHEAVAGGASIINMSFGKVADDPKVTEAIDQASEQGIVVVAAAGDTGSPQALFPADLAEVIAVQALGPNGKPSISANPVGANGVGAPGRDIPAVRGGRVFESHGSSIATAVVSGAVALLESCAHRRLGRQEVVGALRASAGSGAWFNLRAALRAVGCAWAG